MARHGASAECVASITFHRIAFVSEMAPANDITQLLAEWSKGDEESLEKLLHLVYDELRRVAAEEMRGERRDHTLQPTALVHEAFMRLAKLRHIHWPNRAHFFTSAARIMRRILVDHARKHRAAKRGGGRRQQFQEFLVLTDDQADEISALDDALDDLERLDQRQSRIVELRYFGGFSVLETAKTLEVSQATVKRDWAVARAWLQAYMEPTGGVSEPGH